MVYFKDNIKIPPRNMDREEVNGLNGLREGPVRLLFPCDGVYGTTALDRYHFGVPRIRPCA